MPQSRKPDARVVGHLPVRTPCPTLDALIKQLDQLPAKPRK